MSASLVAIAIFICNLLLLWFISSCLLKYAYLRFKRRYIFADVFTVISGMLLLLCLSLMQLVDTDTFRNLDAHNNNFVLGFLTLALANSVIISILKKLEMRKYTLSQLSIKQGVDCVPYGLGFFTGEGKPGLVNRQLDMLSTELTGANIDNGNQFWHRITCFDILDGNVVLSAGREPSIRFSNGDIWSFSKKDTEINGLDLYQITATNITDIYNLKLTLEKENERRRLYNENLKNYAQTVDDYTRSREILNAKVKIHDDLGRILIMAQRSMQSDSISERSKTLKLWKQTINGFKYARENDEVKGTLEDIVKAAEQIGVKICLNGEVPEANSKASLILDAVVHESLTNAVRHAGGTELYVDCKKNNGIYEFVCRNNGTAPEINIVEGGGLSSLRERIEKAGGMMTVERAPIFRLIVNIPEVNDG